ncbi:flagellin [Rugamonas sp. DEMB1]|jgi:flagellin|uniref:flagellin N-terminal helical domain-containing protein n=1 Tax=Rugamonas sp. DEMB1 TaxID=3039386 RepID=UPI0024489B43|nr:flagellin [Rugamonas sp. DEMB1]WGG48351.1 flagellin [Rugamonas sp. DEMB1]
MLSLHTNAAALSAQNSITRTQSSLSTSQTRLSTGFRINSAMDDAAGLQIATRLKAQTSGMAVAMRNTQNSISMMQTAEGALDETTNILIRMKDLATQAADGSSNAADKTSMQSEFDALTQELTNIVGNTSFGGQKLMNDTTGTFALGAGVDFQIGASTTEKMNVNVSAAIGVMHGAIVAAATGYVNTGVAATPSGTELTATAGATIDLLKTAIDEVGTVRSQLGAASNRLDHVYNNLANVSTNTKAAAGRIMDTDFAAESSSMTSNQMLLQAGTAMLKQSNSTSSLVMSLLQ